MGLNKTLAPICNRCRQNVWIDPAKSTDCNRAKARIKNPRQRPEIQICEPGEAKSALATGNQRKSAKSAGTKFKLSRSAEVIRVVIDTDIELTK